MLKSLSIAATLLAVTAATVCLAQDKPAETLPGAVINLQLEGASPEEAFAELAKQANVQIKPMGMGQNLWAKADPVELKVENGRFWPVFIDMCQQANVKFNPMYYGGEPRTIQLFGPEQGMEPFTKNPNVVTQGCVVVLTSANRSYSVSFAHPEQAGTSFGIQAMFLPDPGMEMSGNVQGVVTEAVDENGTSLVPAQNENRYYGGQGRTLMQHLSMNLSYPANTGKKLVRLKGEVRGTLVTKSEVLTIDSPTDAQPAKKDTAMFSVQVKSVKAAGNTVEVQLSIQSKRPLRGMDYQNLWNLTSAIELTDADGNRYASMGGGQTPGTPQSIEATMRYGNHNPNVKLGKPVKLTWTLPVETKDIRIPFEFKDLPIP